MMVQVGDYIYEQQPTAPDSAGVSWIYCIRRRVSSIAGNTVTLTNTEAAEFPTHSPPALEDIAWLVARSGQAVTPSMAAIDAPGSRYRSVLTLPEAEVIPDETAVRDAWYQFINHRYVNRERGKPAPVPTDATQTYQFAIIEWRDGLPHPSAG